MDYYAQHMHNCDLVNLEDMLQNGTVISGTLIEKPHSFSTACNIATQIIAQVASSQYGGQSISLAHLAPFVQVSGKKIRRQVMEEAAELGGKVSEAVVSRIVERRLLDEITPGGVQTIQYQVVTLMTTNGQAPLRHGIHVSERGQRRAGETGSGPDHRGGPPAALRGVKTRRACGLPRRSPSSFMCWRRTMSIPIPPTITLTELAAKCTAKRLVPDYISEKKMKELKEGNCFPVMGCRSALTPWKDENGNYKFYGGSIRGW